jgi:hypothetical protein
MWVHVRELLDVEGSPCPSYACPVLRTAPQQSLSLIMQYRTVAVLRRERATTGISPSRPAFVSVEVSTEDNNGRPPYSAFPRPRFAIT